MTSIRSVFKDILEEEEHKNEMLSPSWEFRRVINAIHGGLIKFIDPKLLEKYKTQLIKFGYGKYLKA